MIIIENCILLAMLAVFAWIDFKKKELPLLFLAPCAAVGILFFALTDDMTPAVLLGGVCIGGLLLLCALFARRSIGVGDGLLFCVTGLFLGLWGNLILLFLAVVFCAVAGAVLMITKKCTRKKSLPFAPFVLLADVAMLVFMV